MNDEPSKEPRTIVVHTAKHAPSWMPWAVYAGLIGSAYMFKETDATWAFALVGATAMGMTHLFFKTYNALVRMYNEQRVNAAILAYQQSQEEQASTTQVEGSTPVYTGPGSPTAKVQPSERSSESCANERYVVALKLIEKEKDIGVARDIAWRALEHDNLATRRMQYQPKEKGGESRSL